MQVVDPNNPKTWENWPAPPLPEGIEAEVTKRFGRRDCGCPNVRFAWGQTRLQFQRGKMRLLYVDQRIPAVETARHTLKKLLYVEQVKEYVSTDPETGEMTFIEIDKPHFEVQKFKTLEEVPQVIPADWYYDLEPPALEWIGERLWWIERFKPPHLIAGGLDAWERERWEVWDDPELGKEALTDVLGPFPANGRYETCGVVGINHLYPEYYEEEDYKIDHMQRCSNRYLPDKQKKFCHCPPVSLGMVKRKRVREHLRYREPAMDTVDAISEMFTEAERVERMTPQQRGAERFYNYRKYLEKHNAKLREVRRLGVGDESWKFKSPDSGALGFAGGGSRSYVNGPGYGGTPFGQNAAPGTTVIAGEVVKPNRKQRRAEGSRARKATAA